MDRPETSHENAKHHVSLQVLALHSPHMMATRRTRGALIQASEECPVDKKRAPRRSLLEILLGPWTHMPHPLGG